MRYSPILVNSEYSFHKSAIKIDKYIDTAFKRGQKSISLVDFNVMYGVPEFILKSKEKSLKPVIGLELEIEDFRLILLAKNYDGYKKLNKLSSLKQKGFDIELDSVISPNLFIIDHPTMGYNATYGKMIDSDNYFIGTNKSELEKGVYVEVANVLDESNFHTIRTFNKISKTNLEPSILNFDVNHDFPTVQKAIEIIEQCNIVFPEFKDVFPKYQTGEKTSLEFLKELVQKMAAQKLSNKKNRGTYIRRIKYEMRIIEKLHFEDYFLVLWDIVKWSKENGIVVGPGRGSAVGSLIVFLLDITTIDPIEYELLFERFLNPERVKLPDIDIDIQDNRRNEVIKYIFNKYGEEYSAFISTFSRYTAKAALREVSRLKGISEREINEITKKADSKKQLIDSYKEDPKFRAIIDSKDVNREIFRDALSIETYPKTYSTHAAGIVISNEPITNKMATHLSNDSHNQIQSTMNYLNPFGLIKFDLLSLNNLTLINDIAIEIRRSIQKSIKFELIPLDDEITFKLLREGKTKGIFQLESYGMRKTIMDIQISSFKDFYAAIALYRPGPMKFIPHYINRKLKKEPIEKIAPVYDAVTKDTYGIVVFQEQIMKIAQEYSGMSYGRADLLRRAITADKLVIVNEMRKEFFQGAIERERDSQEIEKVFSILFESAQYGFNKSHAIAYANIGYQLAFLKARFPKEFYATLITKNISSSEDVKEYIQEVKERGVKISSPNVLYSFNKASVVKDTIVLPFQMIKGITERDGLAIINERKQSGQFQDFFDFVSRMMVLHKFDSDKIETLIKSNSLISFGNMASLIETLPVAMRYSKMVASIDGENVSIIKSTIPKPLVSKAKRNVLNEVRNEKNTLGMQFNAFLTEGIETKDKLDSIKDNQIADVVFCIESIRKMKTKNGELFLIADISDSTKSVGLFIFGNLAEELSDTPIGSVVKGKIKKRINDSKEAHTLVQNWKMVKYE